MKKILVIALILIVAGCKPTQKVVNTTTVKDSVSVKVSYEDVSVPVTIPADSVHLEKLISELSETPTIKKSNRTTLSLKKVGDKIIADCNTDELIKTIRLQNKIIEYYIKREINSNQTETIEVKYTPNWVKILAWIGGVFLVLVAVGVILKIKKII